MAISEINDQETWNEFLLSQQTQATPIAIGGQAGIFLQSWEWGEFQKAVGAPAQISAKQKFQLGRPVYRFKNDHGEFAQVIELPLPFGKKYWFIPRGELIEGLTEKARDAGVLFVRFEPLQTLRVTRYALRVTKPISPPQTLLIDLSKTEEELLAAMHEKARYNTRLALRKGVESRTCLPARQVSNHELSNFNTFWKLLQETAKRDGFRTHPKEYYEKMLSAMGTREQGNMGTMRAQLYIAYHGITPVAGAIVGYFGNTATYLHGASAHEHRALMAPYPLHWSIMQEAKNSGYKHYDFWGADEKKWAGVTRYKS